MKILWVCNIMLPEVAEHLGVRASNKEGWLSGLSNEILMRHQENGIQLYVAFPVKKKMDGYRGVIQTKTGTLHCYGFYENVAHAEVYEEELEDKLRCIIDEVEPDVIHCFGTEYAHTLAVMRCTPYPERVLIGIQGVCGVIAKYYMSDIPFYVQKGKTLRDILRRDTVRMQQVKFFMRGEREKEILKYAVNVTGRTEFDRQYVEGLNPDARYFSMNETLRSCFYEGQWDKDKCEPHSIFVSQGDYPLKGLHYMLFAVTLLRLNYPDLKLYIAGNDVVKFKTMTGWLKRSIYGSFLADLMDIYVLGDIFCFLGPLDAEQMKERYLKSSVFVCCSSNENSPNSLGEAMLLGVPCVAADVGGIPSLFEDKKDGILYPGTVESKSILYNKGYLRDSRVMHPVIKVADCLSKAIMQIWENPEEMMRYSENARNHARKTHDREQNYRKMMEIYATIAGQNKE